MVNEGIIGGKWCRGGRGGGGGGGAPINFTTWVSLDSRNSKKERTFQKNWIKTSSGGGGDGAPINFTTA